MSNAPSAKKEEVTTVVPAAVAPDASHKDEAATVTPAAHTDKK